MLCDVSRGFLDFLPDLLLGYHLARTSSHPILPHITSFRFISLYLTFNVEILFCWISRFASYQFISAHFTFFMLCQSFHFTSLRFASLHFTSVHRTLLRHTSLQFISIRFTQFPFFSLLLLTSHHFI